MGRIDVKDLDDSVVQKINSMAKQKGMSRNAYVSAILTQHVAMKEVQSIDNKYECLVKELGDRLDYQNHVLDHAIEIIEDFQNKGAGAINSTFEKGKWNEEDF